MFVLLLKENVIKVVDQQNIFFLNFQAGGVSCLPRSMPQPLCLHRFESAEKMHDHPAHHDYHEHHDHRDHNEHHARCSPLSLTLEGCSKSLGLVLFPTRR